MRSDQELWAADGDWGREWPATMAYGGWEDVVRHYDPKPPDHNVRRIITAGVTTIRNNLFNRHLPERRAAGRKKLLDLKTYSEQANAVKDKFRDTYWLHSPPDSDFTKAHMDFEVKCNPGEEVWLTYNAIVQGGTGEVRWNNVTLARYTEEAGPTFDHTWYGNHLFFGYRQRLSPSPFSKERNLKRAIIKPGPNHLQFVFHRKDPTTEAAARVSIVVKNVTKKFSDCEDRKVCLGKEGLAEHWDRCLTDEGVDIAFEDCERHRNCTCPAKDLRESVLLQYKCIHQKDFDSCYPQHDAVCHEWKSCLRKSEAEGMVESLLDATDAGTANGLPHLKFCQPGKKARLGKTSQVLHRVRAGLKNGASMVNAGLKKWSGDLLADIENTLPCQLVPCNPVPRANFEQNACQMCSALMALSAGMQ